MNRMGITNHPLLNWARERSLHVPLDAAPIKGASLSNAGKTMFLCSLNRSPTTPVMEDA